MVPTMHLAEERGFSIKSQHNLQQGGNCMPRHPMYGELCSFHGASARPLPQVRGPMCHPPPPLEEELALQHDDIRRLHADNEILIDQNVALRGDLAAAEDELHGLSQALPKLRADKEVEARELIQRGLKLEAELRALEPLKAEVLQLQSEAQKLDALQQDLPTRIQSLAHELKHMQTENQQIPTMRTEINGLRQEVRRARMAYEYKKKANAEQMEQRQAHEKNLVSMAREVENLRAELEKRTRGPSTFVPYSVRY